MVEIAPRSGLRSASLVEQVELARLQANSQIDGHVRGALGQFMTPAAVARLMAALLVCDTPHVALLDAGAGVGSLSSAVVEALICRELPPVSLHIAAYEIDPLLAAHLRKTMEQCDRACKDAGVTFAYSIVEGDFVADVVERLANPLFADQPMKYTCAILNPPYRKIQTDSNMRRHLSRVGIETSNLYTGFLALAMQLLVSGGELVAITPRSFCNGLYFRSFRASMLHTLSLQHFHLFNARNDAFQDDEVLQETVIFSVYVTAFLSRATLEEYLADISWETEVWVAEAPDHLIHFNGERFLGPYAA